jgi:carboxymethylenebutenolidase
MVWRMQITLPSGTAADLARPAHTAPTRGLVIAPDIFGLRPLYTALVERLANEWNMAVCAVEPFPGLHLGPEVGTRFAAVPTLDDRRHLADLEAAADRLRKGDADHAGVAAVGLIGFCMGGMYCHKSAGSSAFDRIVSFYGMIHLPDAWRSATQAEPLQCLRDGHAERVLAIIGERDHYTPADAVEELAATGVTVVRYADAEHGFAHDAARPAHRPADAADAFAQAYAWLIG